MVAPSRRSAHRLFLLAGAVLGLAGCSGVAAPIPTRPPAGPVAYGAICYAGPYQCALPASGPIGSSCTCPGLGAPSYGTIH